MQEWYVVSKLSRYSLLTPPADRMTTSRVRRRRRLVLLGGVLLTGFR
jgi:hypothetical protein